MKRALKKIAFATLLLGTATSAFAVDGYKDLKFGMTEAQVKATNLCSFHEVQSSMKGLTHLECTNLPFNGGEAAAGAFFIDGKMSRFSILLSDDQILPVAQALTTKFGAPTKRSSGRKVWEMIDTTPNSEATLWFDNNTVMLSVATGQDLTKSTFLSYTEADFNNRVAQMHSQSVASDI